VFVFVLFGPCFPGWCGHQNSEAETVQQASRQSQRWARSAQRNSHHANKTSENHPSLL